MLAQLGALALNTVLLVSRVHAAEGCTLGRVAEMPVTMAGTVPLITAKINNQDARFVLDSGMFYSMISGATAAEFNLRLKPPPFGFRIEGIGGSVTAQVATRSVTCSVVLPSLGGGMPLQVSSVQTRRERSLGGSQKNRGGLR